MKDNKIDMKFSKLIALLQQSDGHSNLDQLECLALFTSILVEHFKEIKKTKDYPESSVPLISATHIIKEYSKCVMMQPDWEDDFIVKLCHVMSEKMWY